MNLYKMLWSRIGGRPWTYIWRDIYHEYEWVIYLKWLVTGIIVTHFLGWQIALIAFAVFTYGYIHGHFGWGTKWTKGQEGK